MEAEVIKLAQAGVTALQAGPPPNWGGDRGGGGAAWLGWFSAA